MDMSRRNKIPKRYSFFLYFGGISTFLFTICQTFTQKIYMERLEVELWSCFLPLKSNCEFFHLVLAGTWGTVTHVQRLLDYLNCDVRPGTCWKGIESRHVSKEKKKHFLLIIFTHCLSPRQNVQCAWFGLGVCE